MQTRPLGPGAPAVSAVGFGGMPLSIQGRPDEATGVRVIHAALDAGATLIDTADVYCHDDDDIGHNERLIAKALRSWSGPRERIMVATKGGLTRPQGRWERDGRPAHLKRACERSLAALGVERVDLYQLHAPDPAVPLADSAGALADLQREGKVRWVGLSNVSVEEIEEASAIVPVITVQNRLNPFFREALEDGVVAYCTRQEIGFLAYSPLGGGRLNKKLPSHPAAGAISRKHGVSAHVVVLAWVLAQGPTVIAIPGARMVEHARDSANAAGLVLAAEDLAAIDRAQFSRA
ncbi:MAG: aldo/keto reductase [Gemmatimonadetes bacterium]|nr:aldo/keto reductase [Gemmatimonadota bacterium]